MLRWLPDRIVRAYRRIFEARPYAPSTHPARIAPEPDITPGGKERQFRLEVVQDAYCHHRPPFHVLFRNPSAPRDLTSWCEARNRWTGRRGKRCPICERARTQYLAARDEKDWKAECRLFRDARRGAVRLLAERRQYREQRRIMLAATREARERDGPSPAPLGLEMYLDAGSGSRRCGLGHSHVIERREVEEKLVRAHARHLRREEQKRRARLRDLQAGLQISLKAASTLPARTITPDIGHNCAIEGALPAAQSTPQRRSAKARAGRPIRTEAPADLAPRNAADADAAAAAAAAAADDRLPETQAAPEPVDTMRRLRPPPGYVAPRRRRFAEQTIASFSAVTDSGADASGGLQNHDRLHRSDAARHRIGSDGQSAPRLHAAHLVNSVAAIRLVQTQPAFEAANQDMPGGVTAAPASAPSPPHAPHDLDMEGKLAREIASWQSARSKRIDVR